MADSAQTPRTATVRGDRVALAILVAALVVRVGILAFAGSLDLTIDDERQYREIALNILHGNGFAISDQLTSLRPPLYPAFLAFVWWLVGGEHHFAVRVIQVILEPRHLRARLHDQPAPARSDGGADDAGRPRLLSVAAVRQHALALGGTFHVPPHGVRRLLPADHRPPALGARPPDRGGARPRRPDAERPLAVSRCARATGGLGCQGTLRSRLLIAGALLAGYAAVITPWAVRNTRLQGTLTVVDTMGGMNLRMGNYEHTDYDVGVEGVPPVTHEEVVRVFAENNEQAPRPALRRDPRAPRGPRLPVRHRPQRRSVRGLMTGEQVLVRIELTFKTEGDAQGLGDRIEESVRLIVGREALEEFRVRTIPLGRRKGPRPVE